MLKTVGRRIALRGGSQGRRRFPLARPSDEAVQIRLSLAAIRQPPMRVNLRARIVR